MDVLTRDADFINCPHCNHQMRRGMIRCRECNGNIGEDFVLSADVAAGVTTVRRCQRCDAPLDPDADDCRNCASQMLDQFLQAPAPVEAEAPRRFKGPPAGITESRLRPPPRLPPEVPKRSGKQRRKGAERQQPTGDDEAGTDALYESDTDAGSPRSGRTVSDFDRVPSAAAEPEQSAAGDACQSLLLALHTTDIAALCSVVMALGKLGDRSAMGPIERLMANPEIRVRRVAAQALILLGHPKGESLLEIAERRVAAAPAAQAHSVTAKKKSRPPTDWAGLLKPAGALLTVAILGGGIWWWQGRPAGSSKSKDFSKWKAAASKNAAKGAKPAAPSGPSAPTKFDSNPTD